LAESAARAAEATQQERLQRAWHAKQMPSVLAKARRQGSPAEGAEDKGAQRHQRGGDQEAKVRQPEQTPGTRVAGHNWATKHG